MTETQLIQIIQETKKERSDRVQRFVGILRFYREQYRATRLNHDFIEGMAVGVLQAGRLLDFLDAPQEVALMNWVSSWK